jgi:hypothetical protein
MMDRNTLRESRMRRLFVFPNEVHPYEANFVRQWDSLDRKYKRAVFENVATPNDLLQTQPVMQKFQVWPPPSPEIAKKEEEIIAKLPEQWRLKAAEMKKQAVSNVEELLSN